MKTFWIIGIFLLTTKYGVTQKCYPTYSSSEDYIYYFSFNDLHNTISPTGTTGVTIYPDSMFTTKLSLGQSYMMQALGEHQSGVGTNYHVWIDFDNNQSFTPSELIYSSPNWVHGFTTMVSIPQDTSILGKRKLRIVTGYTPNGAQPCGSFNYGECEEYTIEFVSDTILPAYCIPTCTSAYGATSGAEIESFSFNTLHNCLSGQSNPAYIYYPDSVYTTTVEMGKSYNLYISKGTYAGISIGVRAFLDFNNDHVFSASDCIFNTAEKISYTAITIPFDSSFVGKRRLRIFSNRGGVPSSACANFSIGEVEDYDIYITYPTPDTTVVIPNRFEKVYAKAGDQTVSKVIETYDKGYLMAGAEGIYNDYVQLTKTDIDGDVLSQKTHKTWGGHYYASGLDETLDGGYVIAGSTTKGSSSGALGYIKKFTPCGNPDWEQSYGDSSQYGYLREVYQLPDSGYIASGSYLVPSTNNLGRICVLRTDKNGNQLWLNDYTFAYSSDVSSFIPTSDNGGLISLAGYTANANDPSGQLWSRGILTKIDSSGNLEWNVILDTNDILSYASSSIELNNKGYITAGNTYEPYINEPKLALFRISKEGKLLRYKDFSNSGYYYHFPKVIREINPNKYVLLCTDLSDCNLGGYYPNTSLILVDSSFNLLSYKLLSDYSIRASDAIITSDGNILIVGTKMKMKNYDIMAARFNSISLTFDTLYNIVLTYDSLCDPTERITNILAKKLQVIISPNPTNDVLNIEIKNYSSQLYHIECYNYDGVLLDNIINRKSNLTSLTLNKYERGIYLIRIVFADGSVISKKVIKI